MPSRRLIIAFLCLVAGACGRPALPEDPRGDIYYDCTDHLGSEFRLLQGTLAFGRNTDEYRHQLRRQQNAFTELSQNFEAYREEACLCLEDVSENRPSGLDGIAANGFPGLLDIMANARAGGVRKAEGCFQSEGLGPLIETYQSLLLR